MLGIMPRYARHRSAYAIIANSPGMNLMAARILARPTQSNAITVKDLVTQVILLAHALVADFKADQLSEQGVESLRLVEALPVVFVEALQAGLAQAMKCYACGKLGHISRDCTAPNGGPLNSAGKVCYKCGQAGHISRDCTVADTNGGGPVGLDGSVDQAQPAPTTAVA
ncbi:hypothetical protein MMC28_004189 [Mycoblastus sanguinarius]|nr:hypothetical protein [Mycoblastus sanguinarius]